MKKDSDVVCNINSYASDLRARADQDYITARMCYLNGLHENFLWNSQQCIEKYLKAIGLFHQIDIKNQGHDLKSLFKNINKAIKFGCIDHYWPKCTDEIIFFDEDFEKFLSRLTVLGINRYVSYSWVTYGDELVKLDASVAIIRRYCKPIGGSIGNSEKPTEKQMKACIDAGNDFTHTTSSFFQHGKNENLEKFLKEGNAYLEDQKNEGISIKMHSASANHILTRRYEESKNGGPEQIRKKKLIFIELSEYLLDHIYWPNEVRSEIETLVRATYKELITHQPPNP